MAIHPEFAEAILSGRKKVEFRKRPPAPDVTTVLVYATAPVKMIIGEFNIADVVLASPGDLWSRFHEVGCIEKTPYEAYYADRAAGAALLVGSSRRYSKAVALSDLEPAPAVPQSFAYLPAGMLHRVRSMHAARRPLLLRALGVLVSMTSWISGTSASDETIRTPSPDLQRRVGSAA